MKNILLGLFTVASVIISTQAFAGYAAIAYNSSTRTWGEAHGYGSAQDAVDAAVNVCGAGCAWLSWSYNGCVALANNAAGSYGWSWSAPDAASATNSAISSCDSQGTGACDWRVWACN